MVIIFDPTARIAAAACPFFPESAIMPVNNHEKTSRRILELEGIRGLPALTIVLYHFGLTSLVAATTGGFIKTSYWGNAVDVFFIISGFVLAFSQSIRPRSWSHFGINRAFRLLPAHAAILLIFSGSLYDGIPLSTGEILLTFSGLQYFTGGNFWNAMSWSMSIELYLTLAFAIALTLLPRVQSGTNILFGIFLAADCVLLSFHPSTAVGMALLRGFLGLGLGYLLFVTMKDRPAPGFAPFGASSTLVFFLLYLLATLFSDRVWPIGGLVPVIALLMIVSSERSRSILSSGIAVWFGSLTYTIYLFHGPLLEWASNTFGSETLQGNAPLKLALVLLTVVGAWLVSVLVERPAIRLGHRIGSARPQAAGNGNTE